MFQLFQSDRVLISQKTTNDYVIHLYEKWWKNDFICSWELITKVSWQSWLYSNQEHFIVWVKWASEVESEGKIFLTYFMLYLNQEQSLIWSKDVMIQIKCKSWLESTAVGSNEKAKKLSDSNQL